MMHKQTKIVVFMMLLILSHQIARRQHRKQHKIINHYKHHVHSQRLRKAVQQSKPLLVHKRMNRKQDEKQDVKQEDGEPKPDGEKKSDDVDLNKPLGEKVMEKDTKQVLFEQSSQKFYMTLAAYQTSSAVETIDKEQVQQCVGETMMIFENFQKTKLAKPSPKNRPNIVDLINFIFTQLDQLYKEDKNPKGCALKALNKGTDPFSRDETNQAVTHSQDYLQVLSKLEDTIKKIVHEDSNKKLWQSYRSKYFSGKYELSGEVFKTTKKILRVQSDTITRTCSDFRSTFSKVMIGKRTADQEKDMWYYMLRTVALMYEARLYLSQMGFDDNKQAKIPDVMERSKDIVKKKMVAQKEFTVGQNKKPEGDAQTSEEPQLLPDLQAKGDIKPQAEPEALSGAPKPSEDAQLLPDLQAKPDIKQDPQQGEILSGAAQAQNKKIKMKKQIGKQIQKKQVGKQVQKKQLVKQVQKKNKVIKQKKTSKKQ